MEMDYSAQMSRIAKSVMDALASPLDGHWVAEAGLIMERAPLVKPPLYPQWQHHISPRL
jgi:hypothetical protein